MVSQPRRFAILSIAISMLVIGLECTSAEECDYKTCGALMARDGLVSWAVWACCVSLDRFWLISDRIVRRLASKPEMTLPMSALFWLAARSSCATVASWLI